VTIDGRLKPDVVAPGCQLTGDGGITSTFPGDRYKKECGTSMAAPVVTGVAGLIIEQYQKTFGTLPLPSTVKAIVIHTAHDLGTPGPDFSFGYGHIDAQTAVDTVIAKHVIEDVLAANDAEAVAEIRVPANAREVRVTLVWDDAPGTAGAARILVNDLDLTLVDPQGRSHYPFVLNPLVPVEPAVRGVDKVNVTEQVLVLRPQTGSWRVTVKGSAVVQGPQSFSLVWSLAQ
jgi:Subtilase family